MPPLGEYPPPLDPAFAGMWSDKLTMSGGERCGVLGRVPLTSFDRLRMSGTRVSVGMGVR